MSEDKNQEVEVQLDIMEPEIVTEVDKSKGINQPGLTQGVTYVDSNGNTRHKYETLEVLSNRSTYNKVKANEKTTEEVKTEEPVKETPIVIKSEDLVGADVKEDKPKPTAAKTAPKAKPKPKPIDKPIEK